MDVEVLLSCMYQSDTSIIEKTNIRSNALVINQCDNQDYLSYKTEYGFIRMISTKDRGLSKSRNLALDQASGDICIICDDDEIFYDNYVELLNKCYADNPKADVIAIKIDNTKEFPSKKKKLGYLSSLKISSWQITFKRSSIINNKIKFDESVGSGVSKGGGEENLFLYECLKNKLNIYYIPVSIGKMHEGNSKWFFGFTKEYFYDRGIFTKKLLGYLGASLYALYFIVFKYKIYKNNVSFFDAIVNIYKGIFAK